MRKIIKVLSIISVVCLIFAGCAKKDIGVIGGDDSRSPEATEKAKKEKGKDLSELTERTIGAVITLSDGREISLELYPDLAPKTVKNFVKNAESGFYGGTIFHRVIEGFMIQGGGYDTDYNPKSVSKAIKGEFAENGVDNDLSHLRGVISMARNEDYDSATTQFFIVHENSVYLDGEYAAFGRVTGGMEIVDEIATAEQLNNPPSGFNNVPAKQYIIDSVTITD